MREVKYRVYDPIERTVTPLDEIIIDSKMFDVIAAEDNHGGRHIHLWPVIMGICEEYELQLSQYIGCKDKYGKEIYENDIVTYTAQFELGIQEINATVVWLDELSAYYLVRATAELLHSIGNDAIEVIGNAYQNPELLEATK